MTVTPAYGRDYKSAKAALADWNAGMDFVIADMFSNFDGSYINKADANADANLCRIMIRYNKLTRIVPVPA